MRITLTSEGGAIFPVDIADDADLETIIALARMEAGLDESTPIRLIHNGKILNNLKATLTESNIQNDDILLFTSINSNGPRVAATSNNPGTSSLQFIDFSNIKIPSKDSKKAPRKQPTSSGSTKEEDLNMAAEQLRNMIASDPAKMAQLRERNPELAALLASGDTALGKFLQTHAQEQLAKQQRIIQGLRNPFSAEAQLLIEEEIQRENIESLLEHAMEHTPEAFGQVTMLYIRCKLNGHDIKAFVDCGAQATIISQACAGRCNIMRLVDTRFAGVAKGIGTQKILGKVHLAQLQVENNYFPVSLTILEDQTMDMLLGLDMMKRHQCVIDLKENVLHFGTTNTMTPFLPESDLPSYAKLGPQNSDVEMDGDLALALQKSAEDQPQSTSTQNTMPTSSAHSPNDEKILKLVAMGFAKEAAIAELARNNGDLNKTVAALLAKTVPSTP